MNRDTGREVSGWDACIQRLKELWSTPIRTRVLRRDYGSDVPELIDRPGNSDLLLELVLAMGDAEEWEPCFRLTRANIVSAGSDGVFTLDIWGYFFPNGHLGDYSIVELVHGQRLRIA